MCDDESVRFNYIDSGTPLRKSCASDADDAARQREDGVAPSFTRGEPNWCPRRGQGGEQTVLAVPIVFTGPEAALVHWHLHCPALLDRDSGLRGLATASPHSSAVRNLGRLIMIVMIAKTDLTQCNVQSLTTLIGPVSIG
jgi:hypothetical protein